MISQVKKNIKVYVAMSGGVDSSVAAALLSRQGFNVTGVFMKPWQPFDKAQGKPSLCMWQGDREDAMRAAAVLGIRLLTWDFSKEYKKEVGDYMIREYRAGRTPNPDVMCNKEIKFGLFLKKALKEGANFIATGHYVRKVERRKVKVVRKVKSQENLTTYYSLLIAHDSNKDQSYFLWTLTQEQLRHSLFPIGDYIKPEVRKMAKKFGLPNHDKKDSQGVCFIGPLDMKEFLKRYIKNKKGKIIDKDGNLVGEHDGAFYYTIGQRHGLNVGNGQGPYYVIDKNLKKNIIYVGKEKDLGGREAKISNISWINKPKLPALINVKIRYRSRSEKAILYKNGSLKFKNLIRAITPGQSAVFYKDKEMLGGGIIS
ncbi:MAG: tRNA 2-thiouridine(34) synthase MnmA [bacterium]|nr:tRNA 2-thiouridine(34) synthase MnmA [bacterium]